MTALPVPAPFTPADPSGIPRWKKLYDYLTPTKMDVNEIVTYERLMFILSPPGTPDPVSKDVATAAFREAAAHILRDFSQSFRNIPGTGYRKIQPNEHADNADLQRRRAFKAVKRGHAQVEHVPREELTVAERKRNDHMAEVLSSHAETLSALSKTIVHHDTRIATTERELEETRARVTTMEKALRDHGFVVPPPPATPPIVIDADADPEPEPDKE